MKRLFNVALREFAATVLTKGFLIGIVMTPLLLLIVVGAVMLARLAPPPRVAGKLAVVDESNLVLPLLNEVFSTEQFKRDAEQTAARLGEAAADQAQKLGVSPDQAQSAKDLMLRSAQQAVARAEIRIEAVGSEQVVAVRSRLGELLPEQWQSAASEYAADSAALPTIGLVVIPPSLVLYRSPADAEKSAVDSGDQPLQVQPMLDKPVNADLEMYFPARLDPEIRLRIERKVVQAIINARLANDPRLAQGGLSVSDVRTLLQEPSIRERSIVTGGQEKDAAGEIQLLIPGAFMFLLLMAVFTGGQYLLTTTIEEKSSRVMEVLLSAVSPMQLMVGKILGQMGASIVILLVYSGLGITLLIAQASEHLLNPFHLVYLGIFFLLGFFSIASFMAAVGSAVTELREAQTLMAPIMVVTIIPWLLWLPISRSPNGTLATVLSFVPMLNPFVMMIRIPGSEPIPVWQIILSIVIAALTACLMAYLAAKVFRVGVLMFGKPPSYRTLLKWIRMA